MKKSGKAQKMLTETIFLSTFSVGLQGLGLLLNIFLTKRLGAASVGEMTLIGSFYSLAAVLSGGGGFIATSRFLSEELGCGGNPHRVFQYAIRFCMILSISFTALLWLLAPLPVRLLHQADIGANTVRLLSASLPAAALLSCLKGRCYAYNRVYLPALSECAEFFIRAAVLAFATIFLIPQGELTIAGAFGISMLAGEGSAVLFLLAFRMPFRDNCNVCSFTFGNFFRLVLPIIGNASLVALLSSTNDTLVPLTLLQFGSSTEQALAQFGEFEAIIIPTLFFPSVIQCCMSGLLVPELSRMKTAKDDAAIRMTTERVLEQTVAYSLFVLIFLVQFGVQLGSWLGGDLVTGRVLQFMAPVVPFIYLEIILEGILRGMGKHNFSTVNYLAEYIVRISVLLICVPLFGFYGIVASYMACNLTGNAVRLFFVLRLTRLKPVWMRIIVRPAFAAILSWQLAMLSLFFIKRTGCPEIVRMVIFALLFGSLYWFLLHYLNHIPRRTDSGVSERSCAA